LTNSNGRTRIDEDRGSSITRYWVEIGSVTKDVRIVIVVDE